jgi:hypothetical protein
MDSSSEEEEAVVVAAAAADYFPAEGREERPWSW